MESMFELAVVFNSDIGLWDTSNVQDMGNLFRDAPAFDADISAWDTSNVTDMSYMFYGATAFNPCHVRRWKTDQADKLDWLLTVDKHTVTQCLLQDAAVSAAPSLRLCHVVVPLLALLWLL
eukprot:5339315-Amphidinium_carterae.1